MSDEMIEIKIGGDASGYIQAAKEALRETTLLSEACEKMAYATDKQAEAMNDAATSAKKHTIETKELGEETSKLEKMLPSLTSLAKGFIGAWVGVEGIKKAWAMVREELERLEEAQKKLGAGSMSMDQAAKGLAVQMGGVGKMREAEGRITETMKAGKLSSIGQAQEIAMAGNLAWGGLEDERGMTKAAAQFVGRQGLGQKETADLFESIKKMGAKSPEDVKAYSQMIADSFQLEKPGMTFGGYLGKVRETTAEIPLSDTMRQGLGRRFDTEQGMYEESLLARREGSRTRIALNEVRADASMKLGSDVLAEAGSLKPVLESGQPVEGVGDQGMLRAAMMVTPEEDVPGLIARRKLQSQADEVTEGLFESKMWQPPMMMGYAPPPQQYFTPTEGSGAAGEQAAQIQTMLAGSVGGVGGGNEPTPSVFGEIVNRLLDLITLNQKISENTAEIVNRTQTAPIERPGSHF